MSAPIINALYANLEKSKKIAVVYDGDSYMSITDPLLNRKIDYHLEKGHELIGVYRHGCGIRYLLDDIGTTPGRRYGR